MNFLSMLLSFVFAAADDASDAGKAIAVGVGGGLGAVGAGVGIGIIFGNYLSGALRNPGAAQGQFTNLLVGFALCEFTGLLGVVMAFIILFT